jgi:hypothetical protein
MVKVENNLWLGLGMGFIFPLSVYLLLSMTDLERYFLPEKPMALYAIAVLGNLICLRIAYRAGRDQIGKGIIIMTFLVMVLYLATHKVTV